MNKSKKRPEVRPDPLHNFNKALQRWNDAHRAGLTFENYVKGHIEIHIHYVLGGMPLELRDYCAVAKLQQRHAAIEFDSSVVPGRGLEMTAIDDSHSGQQEFVLVDYVEIMQQTESAFVPATGSIVRLQSLKHCQFVGIDPVLQLTFPPLEASEVFKDGEIRGRGIEINSVRVPLGNESNKEVIKSAASVVNAVTNEERPFNNGRWISNAQAKNKLPRFSIRFLNKGIGFTVDGVGLEGRLECAKVIPCPADFGIEA